MGRWLWLCLPVLFLSPSVFAINALVSHDVFYLKENKQELSFAPYMELYWQIDAGTLHFAQNDNKEWLSSIQTEIILRGDSGILSRQQFILNTTPAASRQAALTQNIIDLHRLALPPGKVLIDLRFSDIADQGNTFVYHDSIEVNAAPATPFFSDIQILDTSIYSADTKNIFYKNGVLQIPLSTNFLDEQRDILRYYAELYRPQLSSAATFRQRTFISRRPMDMPIQGLTTTDTIRRKDPILPIHGSFNTEKLSSGNYYLNIVLENEEGLRMAEASRFFQRVNTPPPVVKDTAVAKADTGYQKVTILDLSSTFVGKYTMPQLRAILKMLAPTSTPIEQENIKGFLKKPDETYMRYFILNYWQERNKDEPEREWKKYSGRIKEVNKLFGNSGRPGYETERGQIYLRFGNPNERVIVNNETGAVPYEIWVYNSTERQSSPGIFLFYRPGFMISDYKLLHSTVNGELRNTAWREFLYISGSSAAATSNFRAEQYLK